MSNVAEKRDNRGNVKFRRLKDQRRGQIMDAALVLFAERGVSGAAIADIAESAGISVGTFYLYFENKDELLLALLDDAIARLRQILGRAFARGRGPLDSFERSGRAFFREFCNDRREMLILVLRESVGLSPEIEQQRMRVFELLIHDIANALLRVSGSGGRRARRQAEVVAVSILGMLERMAYHYYIWQIGSKDLRKVEQEALAFILDGLGSALPKEG
ncbi:MAG: TetR/AcrR family transcriptional regulator [Candidatus Alcyoniella australis]|nr:TetR/AcrR family transcriptional regulator [Candidatus Alcyoniella australis]